MQAARVALLRQRLAERCPGRGTDHRDARDLAEVRHGAGRAGIDFNHIRLIVFNHKLNVHQPDDFERQCKLGCIRHHLVYRFGLNRLRRIDRHRVARMHTRPLDMLHDARQQAAALSVSDHVHFRFLADQVAVHEDRRTLGNVFRVAHIFH